MIHEAPDTYSPARFNAAVKKICRSEGILPNELVQDAKVSRHLFNAATGKKIISDRTRQAIVKALGEATKLGIKTPADIVALAEAMPEITRKSVHSAIAKMAANRNVTLADLENKAAELTSLKCDRSPANFEIYYFKAKALGCSSLGDMLVKASLLSPEMGDNILFPKVRELQEARGMEHKQMAYGLGMAKASYQHMIWKNHFSIHVRRKLPAVFGLASLEEIVAEADKLEPMPDRAEYGRAVRNVCTNFTPRISAAQLAHKVGCAANTIDRIEQNDLVNPPSSYWLRKIPAVLGFKSIKDMIERANEYPDVTRAEYPRKHSKFSAEECAFTQASGIDAAQGQEMKTVSVTTWTNYIDQSRRVHTRKR